MPFKRRYIRVLLIPLCAGLLSVPGFHGAQQLPVDYSNLFDKNEVMIPMRDGVQLYTEIYTPKNVGEPLPILMNRTPYGIASPDQGISRLMQRYADMVPDGYIFVFQDIRGRYGSEGRFVMLRPVHDASDAKGVDESTDTYDTIDWLVKNVAHNNGRVGLDGISYDGFLVTMGMVQPHPALKAASEQACMGDTWRGDDFFHNCAFRLSYAFEYTPLLETSNENYSFPFDRFDLFEWYLGLGALSNANGKYFHGKIPTWNEFIAHPNYDEFWKRHAVAYGLREPTVPNLNVAGWWDQEDFYGPVATYERLEKSDQKNLNFLVAGPWNHGGWGGGRGNSLETISFGSDTGVYFRQKIEAPWFAYWLKDKGKLPLNEALLFQTGSDTWTAFDSWPPREAKRRSLYLRENGGLSFDPPQGAGDAFDSYHGQAYESSDGAADGYGDQGDDRWNTGYREAYDDDVDQNADDSRYGRALVPAAADGSNLPDIFTEEDAGPFIIPGTGQLLGPSYIPRRERPLAMRLAVIALTACVVFSALFAVAPLGSGAVDAAGGGATSPFEALSGAVMWHSGPGYRWYTAVKGDTIDSIATKFNCQVGGIYELNSLLSGQEIEVGKAYKIPTDPNYGQYYRPPSYIVGGGGYGATTYGNSPWTSMAGIPPEGALCGPNGNGNYAL